MLQHSVVFVCEMIAYMGGAACERVRDGAAFGVAFCWFCGVGGVVRSCAVRRCGVGCRDVVESFVYAVERRGVCARWERVWVFGLRRGVPCDRVRVVDALVDAGDAAARGWARSWVPVGFHLGSLFFWPVLTFYFGGAVWLLIKGCVGV